MVATLPTLGRATWTDKVDNWRVLDTDWVQDRLILRYASAPTPAMGEGGVYYDTTTKCLMLRNSATSTDPLACVAAAANLRVYPGASDSTVTLGHMTTPGNGLVISSTGALTVKPSIATVGNTVFIDATGIAIKIGAATAKLTTSATDLVSDKPITAPTFNGNVVAVASTNAKALTATSGSFSSNVSVTGTFAVTGNSDLSTLDLDTLNFGATLGQHINLYGTTYGIGIQSSNLYFRSASAYKFYVGGTHTDAPTAATLSIDTNSIDVTGSFTVTGTAAVNGTIYSGTVIHAGSASAALRLIGTGVTNNIYMEWYGHGTTTVGGTRHAWAGFNSSTEFNIRNEQTNGGMRLLVPGTGDITLQTGTGGTVTSSTTNINWSATNVLMTSGAGGIILNSGGSNGIVFQTSGTERGRAYSSFMWGKSAGGIANIGVELFESGTIYSTSSTLANLQLRHNGAIDADGMAFVQFWNTAGVLSEIQQDDVAPKGIKINNCAVTAPSDYRWKDDLGPVTGALDQVMALRPKHLAWNVSGEEFDGFLAHEAGAVVPYLVSGEKDAVDEKGEIDGQGFNYGGLTALLTAAIQELKGEVDAMRSAA